MAVDLINRTFSQLNFQGLSTDEKPTLEGKNIGSSFLVLDTGEVYRWTSQLLWVKVGG